jgi:hypothetical protein
MIELVIAVLSTSAGVYGTSAGSKLVSGTNYRAFRDGLAETALVPGRLLAVTATALACGEAAVAIIQVTAAIAAVTGAPGSVPTATIALGCAIALTSVLAAGITVVIRSGRHATCACFGARSGRQLNGSHLARNAGLLVLLLVAMVGNQIRHGRPVPAAAIVAIAAGAIIALLLIRFDDLAELFAPLRREIAR